MRHFARYPGWRLCQITLSNSEQQDRSHEISSDGRSDKRPAVRRALHPDHQSLTLRRMRPHRRATLPTLSSAPRYPTTSSQRSRYSPSGAPVGKTALTPDIVAADWRRMKGPYRRDPRGQDRQNALQQIGRFRAQITALKERQFAAGEPPRTEGEGEMSRRRDRSRTSRWAATCNPTPLLDWRRASGPAPVQAPAPPRANEDSPARWALIGRDNVSSH
jgi:hypothetical protein